jgi:hypothetical protein
MTNPRQGAGKPRRLLLIIAVNVAIILALLLMAETALRIIGSPYTGEYVPSENAVARFDPELGWSYIPNLTKTMRFGEQVRTLTFDDQGIRVPSLGYRLSSVKPSVLFIGGSYTMGHGLSYEESFPGQFEVMTGHALQSVNLGVQAYGTDQALVSLERFAQRFNTRAVVYTFIEDHIYRNGNTDRRYLYPQTVVLGTKPRFALDGNGALSLAERPVLIKDYVHSYLYDLLRMKIETTFGLRPPYPEDVTRALIREMDRYCRDRGILFLLVTWRFRSTDYNGLGDLGVETIDTLDRAPAGWADMIIPGEDHPDAAANRHVARVLVRAVRDRGLLP